MKNFIIAIVCYFTITACQSRIMGMKVQEGIDVSHHQGSISWETIKNNSDKAFAFIKATEGKTGQDRQFITNWKNADDQGLPRGAYHFVRFGTSSPKEQMDNFFAQLRKAGGYTAGDWLALDVEEGPGTPDGAYKLVSEVVEECVDIIHQEIGKYPYIYNRTSFWDKYVQKTPEIVKECPLWIARWRATPPSSAELPKGWTDFKVWQYSCHGRVEGIAGEVDLNKVYLTDL